MSKPLDDQLLAVDFPKYVWLFGRKRWHAYLVASMHMQIMCRFTLSDQNNQGTRSPTDNRPVCERCRINVTRAITEE